MSRKKQWAVMIVNLKGSHCPDSLVMSYNPQICIIRTLPCPEEDSEDIYVEGPLDRWSMKQEGDLVILEETGRVFNTSPVFREVKEGE